MQTFAENNGLFDKLPKHVVAMNAGYLDMAGVVGYHIVPEENRCLVLFSTCKLLLDTFIQSGMGYSKGQLHVDFTFKLLQEMIPFLVMSVPDIQQHCHLTVLGPSTHQDEAMLKIALGIVKDAITKIARIVIQGSTGVWPAEWPVGLCAALAHYGPHITKAATESAPSTRTPRSRSTALSTCRPALWRTRQTPSATPPSTSLTRSSSSCSCAGCMCGVP